MNADTNTARRRFLARSLAAPLLPLSLALAASSCHAHGDAELSAASSLSLSLPVAVLVAAPVAFLSAGVALTVVAVEVVAGATIWVVQRASDGARASLRLSGELAGASIVGVGTALAVTAISAGWLISAAGEVLCLVPNAIGEALLYDERVR